MFKYIFNRAKNQWKLLSLLWISFLIANTFIISGPTYLGWVKKMIYDDGLNQTPPTTRNISLTTGSQPLIKDSFDENNLIINNLANQNLSELFIEQSSAIQSTEYFWGKETPDNNRTASKLKFVSMDKEENFVDSKDKLNELPDNYIGVAGPKKRLDQLGLEPIYKVDKNPLTWLDTMLNAVEHMNFFEGRATEYSKASTQGTWAEAFS